MVFYRPQVRVLLGSRSGRFTFARTCLTFSVAAFGLMAVANETGRGSSGGGSGGDAKMITASEILPHDGEPIVKPFQETFDRCVSEASGSLSPGGSNRCKFQNMGIMPSKEHLATSPGSCHNIGKAIDVGKIDCGSSKKDPQKDHAFFSKVAGCFAKTPAKDGKEFTKVLYDFADGSDPKVAKSSKGDHHDHIHIQWDCKTGDSSNFQSAAKKAGA
jgi:hypothetical protein